MKSEELSTFLNISGIPTTSFYEYKISNFIQNELNQMGLEFTIDEWGNIEIFIEGTSQEELVFISHMDHPGFELTEKISDSKYKAIPLGGLPKNCENLSTPIIVFDNEKIVKGKILKSSDSSIVEDYRWLTKKEVIIEVNESIDLPAPAVFDLPEPKISGNQVITPVADDLAGCSIILETFKKLKNVKTKYSMRAIFTRAEEVGLVGARVIADSKRIKNDSIIVSIETSSELPGAVSGLGPIIRAGDRISTFNNDGEIILLSAIQKIQETDKGFKFQRQLMNLGGCEASAFLPFGYRVTGITLPLINWHNSTPDGNVEPERINILDYENAIKIMTNIGKLDIVEPEKYYKRLIDLPDEADRLKGN